MSAWYGHHLPSAHIAAILVIPRLCSTSYSSEMGGHIGNNQLSERYGSLLIAIARISKAVLKLV
jgi:hypothetical protein